MRPHGLTLVLMLAAAELGAPHKAAAGGGGGRGLSIRRLTPRARALAPRASIDAGSDAEDERAPLLTPPPLDGSRAARLAVLVSVPMAWGTYAPAVKIAYAAATDPPVPGLLIALGQYVVASGCLLVAALASAPPPQPPPQPSEAANAAGWAGGAKAWLAGLELGGYLFVANQLQVRGLQSVPTDRAAFLVQTTTLLVPLGQAALSGGLGKLPARTWAACALAFGGVVLMSSAQEHPAAAANAAAWAGSSLLSSGDLLVLGAAAIYSAHVLRLSALAPALPPITLAVRKALSELVLGSAALGAALFLLPGSELAVATRAFAAELPSLPPDALLRLGGSAAWCGAVTCAYTIWAQSYGQGGPISATDANLVYTTQPLWSALCAYALLGETLTTQEAGGAAVVAAALALAASAPTDGAGAEEGAVVGAGRLDE